MTRFKNKKIYFTLGIALALAVVVFLAWPAEKTPTLSQAAAAAGSKQTSTTTPAAFDKSRYSIDQASSLWAVVNKGRVLPSTYVPAGLTVPNLPLRTNAQDPEMHVRAETALAMEQMFAAARSDGLNLMLASGYRSYSEQSILYARYSAQSGVQQADTFSARPGHSEHQTGLAADIEPASHHCEVDQCFADTPEGVWLAANSYKYGFIIRYQKTTQALTGYEYEPWHVRYLGTDLAQQLHSSGQTLEQFFDLPTYSSYPAAGYGLKS
jgi:D-alanyl-D-alanine carboxypeptidase